VQDGDDFSGGVTVRGLPTDDTTYFTTGGSKDVNDINQWMHQTGDVAPDKDEILNAYSAAYIYQGPDVCPDDVPGLTCATDVAPRQCTCAGDMILTFGLDRFANNGDAQVGFWFFQSPHSRNPDGPSAGSTTSATSCVEPLHPWASLTASRSTM
jgi:hypothetical protein